MRPAAPHGLRHGKPEPLHQLERAFGRRLLALGDDESDGGGADKLKLTRSVNDHVHKEDTSAEVKAILREVYREDDERMRRMLGGTVEMPWDLTQYEL